MATFVYPTSQELSLIAQEKAPRLMADRPIFDIMPVRDVDAFLVSWEQMDNYTGLQNLRGLNGEPTRVKHLGSKRYDMRPGTYGEFTTIDEMELTARRQLGTHGTVIDVSDLVMMRQDHLLGRRLDRIEWIGWKLLTAGIFSVALPYGTGVLHTDAYTFQTFTASPLWTVPATATPLLNLRAIKLLGRGKGVNFGNGAKLYMNQTMVNALLNNSNANDLYGRRHTGLQTLNNLADFNALFMGDDLPQVVVYDEGYLDENGTFQLFIPDGKAVLVGRRAGGERIAEYQMTRNVNNPDMAPGAYMKVFDRGETHVPRSLEIHDGHNGGPAIYYPGSIVVLTI
jgi:hypothetical protein